MHAPVRCPVSMEGGAMRGLLWSGRVAAVWSGWVSASWVKAHDTGLMGRPIDGRPDDPLPLLAFVTVCGLLWALVGFMFDE